MKGTGWNLTLPQWKETIAFLNEARQWSGCQLMNALLLSDSFGKKKEMFLSSPNGSRCPPLQALHLWDAEPLRQRCEGLAANGDPVL